MIKIGMCFPEKDYLKLPFEEMKKYLLLFKEEGIYSFDMYTSLILNEEKNINELLSFLYNNNIKVTFHYNGNLDNQTKDKLIRLRNKLEANNIYGDTTIVFHASDYVFEYQKYDNIEKQINFFKELCIFGETLHFNILIETLSHNHPEGNHIGDDFYELRELINKVNRENFGICWDIGHTELNFLEEYDNIYIPQDLINKVKFTHIHNFSKGKDGLERIDHLPLSNNRNDFLEAKYLLKNEYTGVFSIETPTDSLKENIDIYLKSIKILKQELSKE